MAKKFLSFLGTTNYTECTYQWDESNQGKYRSKFVQEALIKTVCKDWGKEDSAVIFLTEKARNDNWYNLEDEERRLKTSLEKTHIKVESISIPDGSTEDEIWEIFDIVSNQIDIGDEVIFDITHSYRSILMLALVILNYVKVVKDAKIMGIYYRAYVGKDSASIFDLTPLDEILEWSQAVNMFLKYGISGHLKDISVERLRAELKHEQWARDTNQFINSLDDLTMCLYTCRGMEITGRNATKKSILAASKLAKDNLKKIKNIEKDKQLKPLIPLMERVEEKLEIFGKNDNLSSGIATVQWSIDNNLIQQAYTALDETMKTYVCMEFDLNSFEYDHREEIVQKSLKIRARETPKNQWDVKTEYRDKVKEIVEALDDQIVDLSNKISERRNDINHFRFNHNAVTYNKLASDIKEYFEEFMNHIS